MEETPRSMEGDIRRVQAARAEARMAADLKAESEKLAAARDARPGLVTYVGAACFALLKDILDFVGIGSLPAIGTVVTLCVSFIIFMLLYLARANQGAVDARYKIRMGLTMIGGTLCESVLFGLNLIPIETLTVIGIYLMDLKLSNEQVSRLEAALGALKKGRGSTIGRAIPR